MSADLDDGCDDDCTEHDYDWCWHCHGDGAGIVGTDWDSDDPINGPYDGEYEKIAAAAAGSRKTAATGDDKTKNHERP